MNAGLLMEAAQTQQTLAASALEQLRAHAQGLDAVVREEIRATLTEELEGLCEDTRRATRALQSLQRMATVRALLISAVSAAGAGAIPFAFAWLLLPSRAEIAALRATRDELSANIAHLSERGAQAQLRHCGAAARLCVRVDRSAGVFGERGDFLVVRGY